MAEIRSWGPIRHLRADATSFVLRYRGEQMRHCGRGPSFWFAPWSTSLAELPADDRELSLSLKGRSSDFQDVVVQGVLTYRIIEPALAAARVDFTIDPRKGAWLRQPLEKIALTLSQLAQQQALVYLQATPVREVLTGGHEPIRKGIEQALRALPLLADLGLELVSVRIGSIKPSSDLERALEAPTREHIQQEADAAAFERRAHAAEKEHDLQEGELQSQVELARREQQLIEQRGVNARQDAAEKAEASRIESDARARDARVASQAQADGVRAVEGARVELERERLASLGALSPGVLAALAAKELAGKLTRIDHLNVTPDLLGTLLGDLLGKGNGQAAKPAGKGAAT